MEYLQNLHTHTSYCDGKDTPEEMVISAINKGFNSLGFSGHSYMHFSVDVGMPLMLTEEYKKEIALLKNKYADKIKLFCGIEGDILSEISYEGYDYVIGSAHYFKIGDEYVAFDREASAVKIIIDKYFGGNGLAYAKAYYEMLATLPACVPTDILGHFDLIAKHSEKADFFDVNSKEYLGYAFDTIDALSGKIPFFEVNTGAVARGYRTSPYPSLPITQRLLEKGFLPIITSDCHDKHKLDCAFSLASNFLLAAGAKERYILTDSGFRAVKIK